MSCLELPSRKEQLKAATSSESLAEVAVRPGYQLTVADLEKLRRRIQEQAQLYSNKIDDDQLSEQELETVTGGLRLPRCGYNNSK